MKQQRHHAIRELLSEGSRERERRVQAGSGLPLAGPIANQDELRRRLAARGIHVTQATLSRDIQELRLTKGPSGYAAANDAEEESSLPGIAQLLGSFGLEARPAGNLLVLITITGGAQPVAAGIDYEGWPEVTGTIAGDDTVLIICPDERQAKALKTRLEGYLG